MVRLKTRYDHPHYKKHFPKRFRLDKNFNMPLEELAKRNPHFREQWKAISEQTKKELAQANTKEERAQITKKANQKIWEQVLKTIKQN
jgi:hypothetical protein